MDLGPYAAFTLLSYAIAAVAIGLFIAWLVFDGRRQRRLIDDLEARGVRRRSGGRTGTG